MMKYLFLLFILMNNGSDANANDIEIEFKKINQKRDRIKNSLSQSDYKSIESVKNILVKKENEFSYFLSSRELTNKEISRFEQLRIAIESLDNQHYLLAWSPLESLNLSEHSSLNAGHAFLFTQNKNIDLRYRDRVSFYIREHAIQAMIYSDFNSIKYIIVKESPEKIKSINKRIDEVQENKDNISYYSNMDAASDSAGYASGLIAQGVGMGLASGGILLSGVGIAVLGAVTPLAAAGALGCCIASSTGAIQFGNFLEEKMAERSRERIKSKSKFHCGSIVAYCLGLEDQASDWGHVSGVDFIPSVLFNKIAENSEIESAQGVPHISTNINPELEKIRQRLSANRPNEDYEYRPFVKWYPLEIEDSETGLSPKQIRKKNFFEECRMYSRFFKSELEWKRIHPMTYESARKNKWISVLCVHMQQTILEKTKQNCFNHARDFTSLETWKRLGWQTYEVAQDNGWVSDISDHLHEETIVQSSNFSGNLLGGLFKKIW